MPLAFAAACTAALTGAAVQPRQPLYAHQRRLLTDLADAVWAAGPQALRRVFRADFEEAADDTARRRVVVDQIASLTDQSATTWHERWVEGRGLV